MGAHVGEGKMGGGDWVPTLTRSLAQELALRQDSVSPLNLRPQRPLAVGTSPHRCSPVLTQPCAAEVAVNEFSISTVI